MSIEASDLSSRLPKAAGTADPSAPALSLATRSSALSGLSVGGVGVGSSLAAGMNSGSMWSFTPRYASAAFRHFLPFGRQPGRRPARASKSACPPRFLTSRVSTGLAGAFLNAPLIGSGRKISNLGFNVGYSGLSLGASLQRDGANLRRCPVRLRRRLELSPGRVLDESAILVQLNQTSRHGLLFRINPDNRTYAFEFGAAYQLRPGISLGGGLQYFSYNSVSVVPAT